MTMTFSKWIVNKKLWVCFKITNGLWYYERRDETNEKQTQLFFIGWYTRKGIGRIFSCSLLCLSFQIGVAQTIKKTIKKTEENKMDQNYSERISLFNRHANCEWASERRMEARITNIYSIREALKARDENLNVPFAECLKGRRFC
jgi:hypothetical protein